MASACRLRILTRPAAAGRTGHEERTMKFYRDLFEASLNRVVPEHDKKRFFQAFYSTFIHMSPETEQHFSRRPGEEGQQMIFKSFFAMLAVNGDLFVPDFLERLARAIHCAMKRSSLHGQWRSPLVLSICAARRSSTIRPQVTDHARR